MPLSRQNKALISSLFGDGKGCDGPLPMTIYVEGDAMNRLLDAARDEGRECPECGGTGFSGYGLGHGDVCGTCCGGSPGTPRSGA